MSSLTLQFGQCGKQLGDVLFATLEQDLKGAPIDAIFPTIEQWFHVTNQWRPRRCVIEVDGANNYALGYKNSNFEQVLDTVQKNAEQADRVLSILSVHSLAGGTGSGCMSCVLETLRAEFPKKLFMNLAVLPNLIGESTTQAYNTLLSLSTIYSVSNLILLVENRNRGNSFVEINKKLSEKLSIVFQNNASIDINRRYRFYQVSSSTMKSSNSSCISRLCLLRGTTEVPQIHSTVVKWMPQAKTICDKRKFLSYDKFIVDVSNGYNNSVKAVNIIVRDAWQMFNSRAYLHNYVTNGVEEDVFLDRFQTMENILDVYRQI